MTWIRSSAEPGLTVLSMTSVTVTSLITFIAWSLCKRWWNGWCGGDCWNRTTGACGWRHLGCANNTSVLRYFSIEIPKTTLHQGICYIMYLNICAYVSRAQSASCSVGSLSCSGCTSVPSRRPYTGTGPTTGCTLYPERQSGDSCSLNIHTHNHNILDTCSTRTLRN